jgi:hypothetical protein
VTKPRCNLGGSGNTRQIGDAAQTIETIGVNRNDVDRNPYTACLPAAVSILVPETRS